MLLLAEELALVAIDPDSGRHALGTRSQLNACLAGLLVAELLLEGAVGGTDRDDAIVVTSGKAPLSATLAAAAQVVADRGPKIKAVLSHMERGLERILGAGTWDQSLAGLVDAGVLAAPAGGIRPRHDLLAPAAQEAIVARLRAAATGDEPLDPRTALLLSMTGPAQLLEVVAPDRSTRRHARGRIDHALDQTELHAIGKVVRRLIAEAAAAAATGAIAATAATSGS